MSQRLLPESADIQRFPRRSFWMFWILCVAFALRVWHLEIKPVHFDEGINGHFVGTIWRDGFYRYDPTNFHGPLYFYILALAERVLGFGIFSFRFVTGLIQIALIFVTGLHRRFVGNIAIWAALVMALSPAFVFYSRYSIHESLFILSQAAFSYGYFLYREEKSPRSAWWMALAVVGLVTTKETFFIFLGAWAIAAAYLSMFEKYTGAYRNLDSRAPMRTNVTLSMWTAICLTCVVLTLALFTGFFIYPRGAVDMFIALKAWIHTGAGHTGHEKPLGYYLELLLKYEWPALIGLALSPLLFIFSNRPMKILLLVGVGTTLAYSLIPYKTPWLVLNLLWPLSFAAGAVIHRSLPPLKMWRGVRTGIAVLCLASIFLMAREMWRLNFKNFAAVDEPYVYVQSTGDFKTAVDVILNHVKTYPEDMSIRVLALNRDSWPMPWLLFHLSNVGWTRANVADFTDAQVIFSDIEDQALVESKLRGVYYVLPFQIRDSYQDGRAYFAENRFKDGVPLGTPTFAGGTP